MMRFVMIPLLKVLGPITGMGGPISASSGLAWQVLDIPM